MLRTGYRSLLTLISVFLLCTCIEPYNPKLGGFTSLLVVDGLITDSNNSYTIKLSRTFQDQITAPLMITDATVFITDNYENSTYLKSIGNGIYKTDSTEFNGIPGRTYVLHISTDGGYYESEPCIMQSVPEIDSIYFEKGEDLINNGTQSNQGIRIYIDSKACDDNQSIRWVVDETWKFKVPYPKRFNFNMADSSVTDVEDVKEFCWKSRKVGDILIYTDYTGQSLPIRKEPLLFVASDQSDRLLIQYSILIKQYSISKKEFDFWNNLKQVNESGEDIFAKQPFTVISNIKNINDPKERILGYFQVSAVKQKRKFITFNDVLGLNLPFFHNSCEQFVKDPFSWPLGFAESPPTWAQIYSMFCIAENYYFVEPHYSSSPGNKHNISEMVFAKPECANCELSGTSTKPDFWIDLN